MFSALVPLAMSEIHLSIVPLHHKKWKNQDKELIPATHPRADHTLNVELMENKLAAPVWKNISDLHPTADQNASHQMNVQTTKHVCKNAAQTHVLEAVGTMLTVMSSTMPRLAHVITSLLVTHSVSVILSPSLHQFELIPATRPRVEVMRFVQNAMVQDRANACQNILVIRTLDVVPNV